MVPKVTDEQRMREQFQEWADSGMRYVTDRRNDGAYISTAADDAWEGFRAGQLARDAEVQALREALEDAQFLIEKLAGWQGMDLSELDDQYDGVITRISAALAGGETGGKGE